jgi:hypothetical protein
MPEMPSQEKLHKIIAGALRDSINMHGPINKRDIGSAAKRIAGQLKPFFPKVQSQPNVKVEETVKPKRSPAR